MVQADKRRGLGRGLSALIPPRPEEQQASTESAPVGRGILKLAMDQVLPSDGQPRQIFDEAAIDELAASIKTHGILQPIVVRRRSEHQYEIVAGERRWRASQRAGLTEIDAVVIDIAEKDTLTVALVENVQRRDLNAIEEAEAYHRLHTELGYSQAEIAQAVGKERATVANALRLLKLPQSVRQMVLNDEISMGHARALLSLEDETLIAKSAATVRDQGWSVRQTESWVAAKRDGGSDTDKKAKKKKTVQETDAERDVRMRLQRSLGTRCELKHRNGKGTVVIHFASFDELDRVLETIGA